MFKRLRFKAPAEIGRIDVSASEVKKGDIIGEKGPFGTAYKSEFRGNNKTVVKYFNSPSKSFKKSFLDEASKLKKLLHPNILLMMGVICDEKIVGVITESMRCNLAQVINEPNKCPKVLQNLTLLQKMKCLREICVGICWIHSGAKLPHGNLKPNNILFDENGCVKIGDFGFSIYRTLSKKNNYYVSSPVSNLYQAPECWTGSACSLKSDVYSFALIILELIVGSASFYGNIDTRNDDEVYSFISSKKMPVIPKDFSESLVKTLESSLEYDPTKRWEMGDVLASFDSIVVDSTMHNDEARDFWKEYYNDGDIPLYEVDYPTMNLTWMSVYEDKEEDEIEETGEELKEKIFLNKDIITAVDFDNVAGWFGPFFKEWDIVDEMLEVGSQPWFFADIDKMTSESRLSGQPNKTFLVRYSFTNVEKSPFTLTRVVGGLVKHSRIERVTYDISAPSRLKIVIDKKSYLGKTLVDLIQTLQEKKIITEALPENADGGEYTSF